MARYLETLTDNAANKYLQKLGRRNINHKHPAIAVIANSSAICRGNVDTCNYRLFKIGHSDCRDCRSRTCNPVSNRLPFFLFVENENGVIMVIIKKVNIIYWHNLPSMHTARPTTFSTPRTAMIVRTDTRPHRSS